MHKLIEYICDELEEIERKVEKGSKLSMAEIQYADTLAHMKKNILKSDEMMEGVEGNSYAMGEYAGNRQQRMNGGNYRYGGENSYARGRGRNARRDSMGRYSRNYSYGNDEMIEQLEELKEDAPEGLKQEIQKLISKVESM